MKSPVLAPATSLVHRAPRALRALLLLAVVALGFLLPRGAWALPEGEAASAVAPADAPLVLQPTGVHLPPLPPGYVQRSNDWMTLAYPEGAAERVEPLLQHAADMRTALTEQLGQAVLAHVEVRVGRTPEDMAKLAPPEIPPPSYASGVAYRSMHLVLLTMTAPRTSEGVDLDEVFRHELAHVALEDALLGHHVPLWFNEGLAVEASGEARFARLKTLVDASLQGTLLPLRDLDRGFPQDHGDVSIAYAQSADFLRFLLRRADQARFAQLISRVRGGQAFESALADAYSTDLRRLEYQWKSELQKRYSIFPVLTGGSLLWVVVFGALIAAYVKRRRRAKATLARWAEEEAALDAARARLIAAGEGAASAPAVGQEVAALRSSVSAAKVEHDGRWHTLH